MNSSKKEKQKEKHEDSDLTPNKNVELPEKKRSCELFALAATLLKNELKGNLCFYAELRARRGHSPIFSLPTSGLEVGEKH